jgi:hypothetical protein
MITISSHYDKRTKKHALHAPAHSHNIDHLSDEDKDKFNRMHSEQHQAHYYESHALDRKLDADKQLLATLERSAKRYEDAGDKKSMTIVHNKIIKLKQSIMRHEKLSHRTKTVVEGIGKFKDTLVAGSGELKDDADKMHAHYVSKIGERFKEHKMPAGAVKAHELKEKDAGKLESLGKEYQLKGNVTVESLKTLYSKNTPVKGDKIKTKSGDYTWDVISVNKLPATGNKKEATEIKVKYGNRTLTVYKNIEERKSNKLIESQPNNPVQKQHVSTNNEPPKAEDYKTAGEYHAARLKWNTEYKTEKSQDSVKLDELNKKITNAEKRLKSNQNEKQGAKPSVISANAFRNIDNELRDLKEERDDLVNKESKPKQTADKAVQKQPVPTNNEQTAKVDNDGNTKVSASQKKLDDYYRTLSINDKSKGLVDAWNVVSVKLRDNTDDTFLNHIKSAIKYERVNKKHTKILQEFIDKQKESPTQIKPEKVDDSPQEGQRNAEGLVFRDGRWHREGEKQNKWDAVKQFLGDDAFNITQDRVWNLDPMAKNLIAETLRLPKVNRNRTAQQNKIANKIATTPGGAGGDVAYDYFYPENYDYRKEIVKMALSEGKQVPENVLADYPDLKKEPRILLNIKRKEPTSSNSLTKENKENTILPEVKENKPEGKKMKNIIEIRKTQSDEFGDNEFLVINGKDLRIKGGTGKQQGYASDLVKESIKRDLNIIRKHEEGNKKRLENGKPVKTDVNELKEQLDDKITKLLGFSAIEILNDQRVLDPVRSI